MRHFIAYHNAKKMGYSCRSIPRPQVQTRVDVKGLEGVNVWLIAGEGGSPKTYFLAAHFIAEECQRNSFPSSEFPHLICGRGLLFGYRFPLRETALFRRLQTDSANFVRGFYETHDSNIVAGLKSFL